MADGQQGSANSHESDEHSPPPIGSKNIREQDRLLPIANISRIMKKAIPPNGKIAKDAKDAVQECVSEFISFITSEASDKCQRERRKTINGYDLLLAMLALGFEDYVDPLKMFLDRYTEPERLTKAADKSIEREGMLPTPSSQLEHQGAFSQGMGYGISQGDMKGSTKAFDGFVKREGMQPSPNSQLANQVSFYQGMSYGISQVDTKGLAKAVDGSVKRERTQPFPNSELADQSLFSQGISYGISQGDAKKGSAKATNVSVKTEGVQASHTSQLAHQGSVSQGMSYGISQVKREGEEIFH